MSPQPLPGADGLAPKAPKSVGQLTRIMLTYARQHGQAEKRTRDWISNMAVAAVLERTGGGGLNTFFALKGGVALEMRLGGRARATRDVDFSYLGPTTNDLVSVIEEALSTPYGLFSFQRTGKPLDMNRVNTLRLEVKVNFNGSDWGTVIVDVNRGEEASVELEMVDAFDIQQAFGVQGPDKLPCLSLHDHIAQKIHGMTLPPSDEETLNQRVQDAVDVLLFRDQFEHGPSLLRLRDACEATFFVRGTHAWPPYFNPPEIWRADFATMASDLGLPIRDLHAATRELRDFIQRIVSGITGPSIEARRKDDKNPGVYLSNP